jgi:hypothetical protein
VLGWTIGAAVSLGGVVYAAGFLAWRGGQGLGLRILGWILMVTALGDPEQAHRWLPLVALLALALPPLRRRAASLRGSAAETMVGVTGSNLGLCV